MKTIRSSMNSVLKSSNYSWKRLYCQLRHCCFQNSPIPVFFIKMTMKPLFKKYQIEWSTSHVLYYNIDRKPELQSHFLFLSVLLFFISLFHRTLTPQMLALYANQIVHQICTSNSTKIME